METVLKAALAASAGALLGLALRKDNPALALCLALAGVCGALALAARPLGEAVGGIRALSEQAGLSSAVTTAVWKTVVIALVTKLAAGVCADSGSSAAASAVELAGCCCAAAAALPLVGAVLEMLEGFL